MKGVKINMQLPDDAVNFIDDAKLQHLIANTKEDLPRARELFKKALNKEALSIEETAVLLAIESEEGLKELFDAARELKRMVYGNRIVLFAPLSVGNSCVNNCKYCGFRRDAKGSVRKTLNNKELVSEIENLDTSPGKAFFLFPDLIIKIHIWLCL